MYLLFQGILKAICYLHIYLSIWDCCSIMGWLQQQSLMGSLQSLWLFFGKECNGWYQNLWQEEKRNPISLNPATSERQLCTETQESRTAYEKKCPSQLESHVEFRWLGKHLLPSRHPHKRLIQQVTPLSCTHQAKASTGTYLQFLTMWVLKGWDKPDTKKQWYRDPGCQLWPHPPSVTSIDFLMWAGHYSWANTPFPNQQSSAEDPNGSQQFPVLADWADVEPELSQTRDVVVLTQPLPCEPTNPDRQEHWL